VNEGASKLPARTRRARVAEKEQAIIDAAHKVFSENSFDQAKMAEISKLAGVAEGTVYLYFENKSALRLAVLGRFYERLTQEAANGVDQIQTTADRLRFLARHHVDSCIRDWSLLMLASADWRINDGYYESDAHRFNRTYVAVFDQVVRAGIDRGELHQSVPLHTIRDIFYGGLDYLTRTLRLRQSSGEIDIAKEVSDFVDAISAGILLNPQTAPMTAAGSLQEVVGRLEAVTVKLEGATK
jgi:TetR/AcrR family fatty acid metabolism transcriptional regulator